jgi:hypothetical protein
MRRFPIAGSWGEPSLALLHVFWSPPGGVLSFSKAKKKEPKKNALGGLPRPEFGRQESDPLGTAPSDQK